MVELGLQDHLHFALILIAVGILGAYVAGLFGIGGGVVLVPAFVTIFPHFGTAHAVIMHTAVGTCLALIVPGASMSARRQHLQGNLDLALLRSWLPGLCAGIVVGSLLMSLFPTTALKLFFVIFLLSTTVYASIKTDRSGASESVPPRVARMIVGPLIGALSVVLGIGGGTFTVPFYRFYRYPLKRAIALSSATGAFIGLGGAIGAICAGWGVDGRPPPSLGYVAITPFLLITPCMMIFAPLGSRSANALPEKLLKRVYVFFLAGMTTYMGYQTYVDLQAP